MRNLYKLNKYRITDAEALKAFKGYAGDDTCGAFLVRSASSSVGILRVIAAAGAGWDHVSVSLVDRCPFWEEMEQIAKLFFRKEEHAMQLHVPKHEHINCHPYVLHWWRPHGVSIPLPPSIMVGVKI